MVLKIKNIFFILLFISLGFLGWKSYNFFFNKETPLVNIYGVEHSGYYCGNVQSTISSNKTGILSVFLDDKPLAKHFKVSAKNQEYPFTIPTRTISNGTHTLKIYFTDNTFNKNKFSQELNFYVDNVPLQAAFVKNETEFKVFQGRTLHVQFQVNKKIKSVKANALSSSYDCYPESKNSSIYEVFIPVTCEENPNEYLLSIDIQDHVGNTLPLEKKFQIVQFPFKKEVLKISQQKFQKEKELGKSSEEFIQDMEKIAELSPKEKLWRGSFCTPIEITRKASDFGVIRITQEKGKYRHNGVDIINEPKSVVWASQAGIVRIKDRYAESGNTVVIDHGCGILSMYFHLEDLANITVGELISKGNPVGTLGQTGYASGYHLHWELRVNNISVDPMQWVKSTF
ncbi:peptidoglycan DD-metalloendopeptidase family protein [Candidatus Dependentiae bacterium]